MKDEFQKWLAQKVDLTGVLAAGLVYPDKTSFSKMFSDVCDAANFDLILASIADTLQVAQRQKLPGTRLQFSFEHFSLHCAFRHDRCCLAALTARPISPIAKTNADRLLEEFQSL